MTDGQLHVEVSTGFGLKEAKDGVNSCRMSPWASAQRQMGSADPPGKMDEKLKSKNMQKRTVFYVSMFMFILRAGEGRQV